MAVKMRFFFISITLLLCIAFNAFSQKITINGYVHDVSTGEKLINTSIYSSDLKLSTTTNNYGFFSITFFTDTVQLFVTYTGYQPYKNVFFLKKDTLLNINLIPGIELSEVNIIENNPETKQAQMSLNKLTIKEIEAIPSFLGEADVLKVIQLLPGVHSGNEGNTGFFVRGGSPDQNLILLDGVPVYSPFHILGFLSVFNPDAIQHVSLIKGGFPARYGERLSSVLDITMKEGNLKELKGEGSIGILSSKLTIEGPIKKDFTSFIISARSSYLHLLVTPILKKLMGGTVGYYFYDINTKINHKFSNKDRIYFSAYFGNDTYYNKGKFENENVTVKVNNNINWGNITSLFRWNHLYGKKLFSNASLSYTKYQYKIGSQSKEIINQTEEDFDFKSYSGVNDWRGNIDFDYFPIVQHHLRFGAGSIYHTFNPGSTDYHISNPDTTYNVTFSDFNINAVELAMYAEDEFNITPRLNANAGIRYSGFYINQHYYKSFQPRLSVNYLFNKNNSIKVSFATMSQYIHLLSNSGLELPTDFWVPATEKILPQSSQQVALGFLKNITDEINLTLEGFYKTMNNIIEYKDGASYLTGNVSWENKVESGKGWSYGGEFMIKKNTGKTTGWLAYTLSWSNRQFDKINFGKKFPYKYDRRHDISLTLNQKINEKIEISGTWVFGTGLAITIPTDVYRSPYGGTIWYFTDRNSFRMPPYHRLDLSVQFHKKKKWGERSWNISVYNAYNRFNPYYISSAGVHSEGGNYQIVTLFPILPSVSYRYSF